MDITDTIAPKSEQVNADDLVQPITVTITGVRRGDTDQPVSIELAEFPGRSYRPCKSMRRVLIQAWGTDATNYVGRRLTLFNDPSVKWGGQAVGGIRIKAMSHIKSRITLALTVTRGQRKPFVVEPLPDAPPAISPDDVAEFERDIAAADTLQALDAVAHDLKARDLGTYRKHLLQAFSDRRTALTADEPAQDNNQ